MKQKPTWSTITALADRLQDEKTTSKSKIFLYRKRICLQPQWYFTNGIKQLASFPMVSISDDCLGTKHKEVCILVLTKL